MNVVEAALVVLNVYEPPYAAGDRLARAERLVFVRDGFHWWAAIFPGLWFLVKRLWLEFAVFSLGAIALAWAMKAAGAPADVTGVLFLIFQILIGFEAGFIQGAALERKGWKLQGTVTGRVQAESERRFLESWLASQPSEPITPPNGSHPQSPQYWAQVALNQARDAIERGRRLIGAKA